MYTELTASVQASGLTWKPSSFHVLGPAGCTLSLPTVQGQPHKEIPCAQSLQWLGQVLSYSASWDVEYDACFSAATAA